MLVKLPLHSIKCTIGVINLSQVSPSTKFIQKTAPSTSTKSNVSALKINFCTHKSKSTSQYYSIWTPPLITTQV